MAMEGLLAKLGPTLVREAAPHLMQMLATFGERFRKDTREIKAAVDAEMASLASSQAGLLSTVGEQRDRIQALQEQVSVVDRKVELLHRTVESLTRQLAANAKTVADAQRSSRTLFLLATFFSLLAFGASAALLALSLLRR